jgi:hypothetical protein
MLPTILSFLHSSCFLANTRKIRKRNKKKKDKKKKDKKKK